MKEKIANFLIYILIGIFLLGFVLLRAGLKNDNSVFSIIGIALMAVVGIIALIHYARSKSKIKSYERELKLELEEFKRNAEKILVDLENVSIKSNVWTEEVVVGESGYRGIDERLGYKNSNVVKVNRNLNTFKLSVPLDGNTIDYVVTVEKDPTTLSMLFAIKKQTYLYRNRRNKDEIYLDLEFLG